MASMQAISHRLTYVDTYAFAMGDHISHSILHVGLARKQRHIEPI